MLLIFGQIVDVSRKNLATLTWIVSGLVTCHSPFDTRRHMNLQVFDVIVHFQTMPYAPSALKHSAGHRVLLKPPLLVRSHGDRSLPDNMPVRGKPLCQL